MARIRSAVRNLVKGELTGAEAARIVIKDSLDADLGRGLNFSQAEIDWIKGVMKQTPEEISRYNSLVGAYETIEYILISAPTFALEASSNLYEACYMIESRLFSNFLKEEEPPIPDYAKESMREGERQTADTIRNIVKEAKALLSDFISTKTVLTEANRHMDINFLQGLKYYYDHATNSIRTFNLVIEGITPSTKPGDELRKLRIGPLDLKNIKPSTKALSGYRNMLARYLGANWWTRTLDRTG